MPKAQKRLPWVGILICGAIIIVLIFLALMNSRGRLPLYTQYLLAEGQITHLRVLQGQGFGQDVTDDIDRDELLYLLANTRMRRDRNAWTGTQTSDWVIEISQTGNQFHRPMHIALGETHGMLTERGFGAYSFRISNGDEIREALERMVAE